MRYMKKKNKQCNDGVGDGFWVTERCANGYYGFWRSGVAGMLYDLFPEVQKSLNVRDKVQ